MNLESFIIETETIRSSTIITSSSTISQILYYFFIVLSLILLICYWWQQSERFVKLGNRLPGQINFPIIGNSHEFWGKSNIEIMDEKILDLSNNDDITRDWIGSKLIVYLNHPDDIQLVLNNKNDDENIDFHRKCLPFTSSKNYTKFIPILENKTMELIDKMKREIGNVFDVHKYMTKSIADMILATTIGGNTNRDDLNYAITLKRNCNIIKNRQLKTYLNYNISLTCPFIKKQDEKQLDAVHDLTERVIKHRRNELIEQQSNIIALKKLPLKTKIDKNIEKRSNKLAMDEILESNYSYKNVQIISNDLIKEFEIHINQMISTPKTLKNIIDNGNYEGKKKQLELNKKQKLPNVSIEDLNDIKMPLPDLSDLIELNMKEYNEIIEEIKEYENYLKENPKIMRFKEIIENGNYDGKYIADYRKNQYIPQQFEAIINNLAMNEPMKNLYGYKKVRLITEELTKRFENVIVALNCEPKSLKTIINNGNYEGNKRARQINIEQKLPEVPMNHLKEMVMPLPELSEVISTTFIEYNELVNEVIEYENFLVENHKSMRFKEIIENGNFDGRFIPDNSKNKYIPQEFNDKDNQLFSNGQTPLTILDLLLKQNKNGTYLTDNEIKKQIDQIIVEGYDTMSVASSFVLALLGEHQNVQQKVYDELMGIFNKSNRPITYKDTVEMEYLDKVIKETLRLYPPMPIIIKDLKENIELASIDQILPGGCSIVISTFKLHRHSNYYTNPQKFNPDNFDIANVQQRHPYCYIPFSNECCIGQNYSLMKLKIIISTILRNYKIKSNVKEKDFKLQADIVLRSADGFNILIEARNS